MTTMAHQAPYHGDSDDVFQKVIRSSLPTIGKSKLDKAQARRLKMPKRNRSAYFLFSMDVRARLKAECAQLSPLETQGLVSKYWKELSCEEKTKYEQRAKEEKMEYLAAMDKFYSNLTPETIEKSKTNKPKKPCSAYAHFVRDIKTDLKKTNPRLIMQEILHVASDKWKCIAEDTRAVYEEKARKDKEQYMSILRSLNPESYESPKKRKGKNSTTSILGKRAAKIEDFQDEEPINKHVKIEGFSVKSETVEEDNESNFTPIKNEESQEASYLSSSPLVLKIDEALEDRSNYEAAYKIEPQMYPMNINTWPETQSNVFGLQTVNSMNGYFVQGVPSGLNLIYNYGPSEDQQQRVLANYSLMKMVQNQQSIEQTIMRKMMEVKNLQAQRMMFNRDLFLTTTNLNGGF